MEALVENEKKEQVPGTGFTHAFSVKAVELYKTTGVPPIAMCGYMARGSRVEPSDGPKCPECKFFWDLKYGPGD